MPKKKEMRLTIIGVVFLLVLIIGASYSYFILINTEQSTETTFSGVNESLDNYGTSVLRQQTEDLHIDLGLSDLAPGKIGTSYYSTDIETEKYNKEQSYHNLSLIEIYDGVATDLMYKCTSEVTIKTDGISSEEISAGDGKVYFGYTSETIGNEAKINPKEIDLRDVVLASEGYNVPIEYYIIGNSNIYLTGGFKITNQASDQNALAGKSINLEISNKNLSCAVEKVNVMPPKDITFYVQNNSDENKYTNSEEVDVYLSWTDEDVDSYCITEGTIDDCVWEKVEGNSVTDKYTIQDNTTGEKKVKAYLKDNGGNVSEEVEDTIIVDNEAPTIETLKIKEEYTNTNEVSVELVGTDNYEVSEYCLVEEANVEGCTWKEITDEIKGTISGEDGTKKLYGYVKDKAGNVSQVKESTEVVLDTQAPTITTVALKGTAATDELASSYTKSTNITVTLDYNDDSSGVNQYCSLVTTDEQAPEASSGCTDKWTSVTTSYTATLANTDGTKYFHVYVKDKAGNVSLVKSNNILLDTTNPVLADANYTVTSSGPTNVTATIGTVTETNPYQYCFKNGSTGSFECGTSKTKEYTATAGTTYTIYAYVIDKAGNVSSTLNKSVTPLLPIYMKPSSSTSIISSTIGEENYLAVEQLQFVKSIPSNLSASNIIGHWDLTDTNKSSANSVIVWLEKSGNKGYKYEKNKWGLLEKTDTQIDLYNLYIGAKDTIYATNLYYVFSSMKNLKKINFDNLNTSETINMNGMFFNDENLTTLNLSNFDTSKVTDMGAMFSSCSNLTTLNLSGFDTSKVTNMSSMFSNCSSLTDIPFKSWSKFVTSSVTDMSFMFQECSNLAALDLSTFDTSKVTDMGYMFKGLKANLPFKSWPKFVTSSVTRMIMMFSEYQGATLDLSTFDTSKVTIMDSMFWGVKANLPFKSWPKFVTSSVTSMDSMFRNYQGTSLDLSTFDTSKVTDMASMFGYCTNLTTLDLSSFTFDKVTEGTSILSGNYETFSRVPSSCQVRVKASQKTIFESKFPYNSSTSYSNYNRRFIPTYV